MGAWLLLVTSLLIWGPFCKVWSFSSPGRPGQPGLLLPGKKGYRRLQFELWARFTNHGMMHRVRNALEADQLNDEPMVYQELRAYTQELFPSGSHMLPSSSRGRLLTRLAAGARRILELGTFTGYSALCFAEVGATVVTMERCPLQAQAARDFLRTHGDIMAGQVVEGLAQEMLPELVACSPKFDMFHLDGSMKSYEEVLDLTLDDLLAEDGMILADNVLFRGMVTAVAEGQGRPEETAQESAAKRFRDIAEKLHAFNVRFLEDDPRTEGLILDQDDGLGIIWRKSSTGNGATVI